MSDASSKPPAETIATPDCATIDGLVEFANADPTLSAVAGRTRQAQDTLKNVVVMLEHADGSQTPLRYRRSG